MKHIIDKSFSFCYSHRVHNQTLDTRFTDRGENLCACRHLHGHEGLVKLFAEEVIAGKNIKSTGMVVDFKMMSWFKNFIDDILDHKMILDINDPLLPHEVPEYYGVDSLNFEKLEQYPQGYWTPKLSELPENVSQAIFEKYEGIVFVDFVPTSENLASWLLTIAVDRMKDIPNVKVCALEYWETPRSHCRVEV